ncbi:MAG: ATP-dependent helicase, partial [Spirochaetaceae bacterium]|nr:ATP-dependent helicase [Spirochaetaceae bacterium]
MIAYDGKRARIIAGPGTGKTAALAARIALLLQSGVDPSHILSLSFTVKAASELSLRITKTAGVSSGSAATTFHALCAAILREQEETRGFVIIGEDERDRLTRRIAARKNGEKRGENAGRNIQGLGRYIETRKRFLLLPHERDLPEPLSSLSLGPDIPAPDTERETLYKSYQDALRQRRALDLDDLIVTAVRLLAGNPALLRHYQARFRFIFVDEYQDTNPAQYALLRLLAPGSGETLWVIGDPNQSIYAFRGSDKRFMDRFVEDYPEAAGFHVTRSFRCAEPVIQAANRLMDTRLTGTAAPARVFSCGYATESAEARDIARRVSRLIGGTSFYALDRRAPVKAWDWDGEPALTRLSSCAIVLRTLKLARPFIKALERY